MLSDLWHDISTEWPGALVVLLFVSPIFIMPSYWYYMSYHSDTGYHFSVCVRTEERDSTCTHMIGKNVASHPCKRNYCVQYVDKLTLHGVTTEVR